VLSLRYAQARCCCDSQNALVQGRVCYPCCAVMQKAAVMIHRMPGGRRVCYPALPCKLAAVVIHRMLWCKEGCAILCCMQQAAVTECSGGGRRCAIPALPCKLAAVVIHRMLWCKEGCAIPALSQLAAVVIHRMLWKKGVLSLRCHASCCCCDSQNALVQGRCVSCAAMQAAVMITECSGGRRCAIPALPCKLAAVVIHRMLVQGRCAIPALSCKLAAVMIHRMLWWKKVCYPCAMHASCCHDPQNAGGRRVCYRCAL
jgi:hypothetical protein